MVSVSITKQNRRISSTTKRSFLSSSVLTKSIVTRRNRRKANLSHEICPRRDDNDQELFVSTSKIKQGFGFIFLVSLLGANNL